MRYRSYCSGLYLAQKNLDHERGIDDVDHDLSVICPRCAGVRMGKTVRSRRFVLRYTSIKIYSRLCSNEDVVDQSEVCKVFGKTVRTVCCCSSRHFDQDKIKAVL